MGRKGFVIYCFSGFWRRTMLQVSTPNKPFYKKEEEKLLRNPSTPRQQNLKSEIQNELEPENQKKYLIRDGKKFPNRSYKFT